MAGALPDCHLGMASSPPSKLRHACELGERNPAESKLGIFPSNLSLVGAPACQPPSHRYLTHENCGGQTQSAHGQVISTDGIEDIFCLVNFTEVFHPVNMLLGPFSC